MGHVVALHGWNDVRWALARAAEVIERRLAVASTLRGASYLLLRMGYMPTSPNAQGQR
ncbi:winged helix-turn-helix domain-containing protein [Actinoplanes sp. NPDC051343]|uniref:winged helix-turn-helix domain-containing protein n=1 Tax=Actinoplanes sp. NPDC051343 TaxID=3363906 RepID=UPI00379AAD41